MAEHILKLDRLLCPMPVIRVQDHIETLNVGDSVKAICTDPGVLNDIPAWARINGHIVIDAVEHNDKYIVTIEVG